MLIDNRKFDIRVWAMISPNWGVQVQDEGQIRTSSQEFNLQESNADVHLTNNAIQKYTESYGKQEEGNQLSYQVFQAKTSVDVDAMKRNITTILNMCFKSVQNKLNRHGRKFCFEIQGFDFMMDTNHKVWLIEANTNPCLDLSSSLLERLIPQMLSDLFQVTIDQMFPLPNNSGEKMDIDPVANPEFQENLSLQINKNDIANNKWMHIFNLRTDKEVPKIIATKPSR